MRRGFALLALGACWLIAASAPADEPPYFEFVQGLRAKHMPDLALEYLQTLSTRRLPADQAVLVPLELAKTRIELATMEADDGRRAALQATARSEFEAFLKANPKHPRAAEANLEIARLAVLQGKAQLSRARRAETKETQRAEMQKARSLFDGAAKLLRAAAKQIDDQLAALGDAKPSDRQALVYARSQAEFELGMNLLDQAQTYTEQAELAKRGDTVKQAIDVLGKLAARDSRSPLGALAKAWQGRCYLENDDPKTARKICTDVSNDTSEAGEAGRRVARYFLMQAEVRETNPKKPVATYQLVEQQGETWLNNYRKYRNTPEGQGVRFELANTYLKHALTLPANQQGQLQARELFIKAQRLFQELEQTESEYTDLARENKLNIILKLSSERSRGDLAKLKDFEECYLRAQFEIAQLRQDEKQLSGEKLEARRKERLATMIAALNRAFDLADSKVAPQDFADARYLLARAYYSTDDYYRAAVVGEDLAHTAAQALRAPAAGTYALYAYTQLLGEDERANAGAEILDADRGRLRRLAEYIEATWPTDSAADVARHQIGRLFLIEKKYPEAIAVLGRISPAYADATRSLYQLGFAALQAQRIGLTASAGRPTYQNQAIAALKRISPLPAGSDPGTAQVYVEARLTLGGLLYAVKDFGQMDAIARDLQEKLNTPGMFDNQTRADLESKAAGLKLLAIYGQAEADYGAGRYVKVRDTLEPFLKQMRNPGDSAKLKELKDPELVPALLGLAMRANVQDNKIDNARQILDLLQKFAPENSSEVLKQLVQTLRAQIQELRQKGESVKPQLDRTVSNFSTFLDQLATQQEKNPQPEMVLFLAQSYASLDNHKRAADLLVQVPEPKPAAQGQQVDPKKVQAYRAAQIMAARELRLDKQYGKAKKLLDEIIGVPAKPGWAQQNLEAQKERIFLAQDQEQYGGRDGAVLAWNALLKQMQPRIKTDAKAKEQYFECYYYLTYCIYKGSQKMTDEKKKSAAIRQAANFIAQLETTQPDMGGEASKKRFDELLQSEPPLKEQVETLRKASK